MSPLARHEVRVVVWQWILAHTKFEYFEASYKPDDTLAAHLQFALKYESANLQLPGMLFNITGYEELADGLHKVRWPRFGFGKSGGVDVIYNNMLEDE